MSVTKWRCNHDEHINKLSEVSCEICGNYRPIIKKFTYHILEEYGEIKLSWAINHSSKAILKYGEKNYDIIGNHGEIVLTEIQHKNKITIKVQNETCEITEEKLILLEKPDIKGFKSSKNFVLEDSTIDLTWETINTSKVSITGIGSVSKSGLLKSIKPKSSFKIIAENEVGKTEKEILINVLPLPKIKEFRVKKQKIEFGKDTELVWNIENAEKVELQWCGNIEIKTGAV